MVGLQADLQNRPQKRLCDDLKALASYRPNMTDRTWTEDENEAIVADYFGMLADDRHRRALTGQCHPHPPATRGDPCRTVLHRFGHRRAFRRHRIEQRLNPRSNLSSAIGSMLPA